MIPFNLEELPDRWLYQVLKKKSHEDNEDKFSTISSEENYSTSKPSSEESSESDSGADLVEVVITTSVVRIKQNPRKKQKATNQICD